MPSCVRTDGPLTAEPGAPSRATRAAVLPVCSAPTTAAGSLAGGLVDVVLRVRVEPVGGAPVPDEAVLPLTWVLAAA